MPDLSYRKIGTVTIPPVYTSLGLQKSAFKQASRRRSRPFDAALNAGPLGQDIVWLFKGPNYYRYNLRTGVFENPDGTVIAGNWGGETWPRVFSSGIDAAAWGGPTFPNFWFMFRENSFIRFNSELGGSWVVDVAPTRMTQGGFHSARGNWFAEGCDVVIAGEGLDDDAKLHVFGGDGQYLRHNLLDGHADITARPIREQFDFPEPFASGIDLAFYDDGMMMLFSGDLCLAYDTRHEEVVEVYPVASRYPAFTRFMSRPQMFLVENYSLETYVGPAQRGKLVGTHFVERGTRQTVRIVTERTSATQSTVNESVLESQSREVMEDFANRLENNTDRFEGADRYRYQMNADFHGDASATGVWGGEVNAQLGVHGSSDSERQSVAKATFDAVSNQVQSSTESMTQKTLTRELTQEELSRVIHQSEFEVVGNDTATRVTEFYQRIEPYYGLLVLKGVRVAFGDGNGHGTVVDLTDLPALAQEKLSEPDTVTQVVDYVRDELANISDHNGQKTSVFSNGREGTNLDFALRSNPSSTFEIQLSDGETQQISVRGLLIKAASEWQSPTTQVLPIDVQ